MEDIIRQNRTEIVRCIKETTIVSLLETTLLTPDEAKQLRTECQQHSSMWVENLLDIVLERQSPGKWTSFQQALKKAKFPYLLSLVRQELHDVDKSYIGIIGIHRHELEKSLYADLPNIIVCLERNKVINMVDRQEIESLSKNKGGMHAAALMLDRMQCRLAPEQWYYSFCQVLLELDKEHVLQFLDPDFLANPSGFSSGKVPQATEMDVCEDDSSLKDHIVTDYIEASTSRNDLSGAPGQSDTQHSSESSSLPPDLDDGEHKLSNIENNLCPLNIKPEMLSKPLLEKDESLTSVKDENKSLTQVKTEVKEEPPESDSEDSNSNPFDSDYDNPLSDRMGTIEENVDRHRELICRCIRDPIVVSYINVLPEDDCSKVRQSFLASSLRGVEDLINRVHRSRASGKWTDFVNAIRNADYPFLADILENKHRSKNGEYQRRMIQIYSPALHKQLQVSDVITELYASDVITDIDKQQVLTTLTQKGNTYATMVLLDLIQCRKAPTEWYSKFLKILHRKGYHELVRAIEPNLQHSIAPYTPGQDYQDARSKKFATLAVPQHDRIPDMQASMRAMKLHSQKRPIIPKPAIPPKSVSQNNAISLKQSQESELVIRKTSAQQREKVSVKSTSSSNQAHQGSTRYVLGPRSCKSVQAERYQGEMRVDIRKWINGIPTKEGVSLHVAQWNNLVESMKHIDKALSKGDKCVRQLGNTAVCLITDDGQGIELYKIDPKTGVKKRISLTIEEYTALKGHTPKIWKTLA